MKFDINNPNYLNSSKEALEFLDKITKNKKNSQWQSLNSDVKNNIVNKLMKRNKAIGEETLINEIAKIILDKNGKIKRNVNKIYNGSPYEFANRQATIRRNYFGNKRDIQQKKMHDDNLYLESLADDILLKDRDNLLKNKELSLEDQMEIVKDYDSLLNNKRKEQSLIPDEEELITKQEPFKQWNKNKPENNLDLLINELIKDKNSKDEVDLDLFFNEYDENISNLVKDNLNDKFTNTKIQDFVNRISNKNNLSSNDSIIDELFNRMTPEDKRYYSNLEYPNEINQLLDNVLNNKVTLNDKNITNNLNNMKRYYNYLDEDVNLSNYKNILDEIRGDNPFDDANYLLDIEEPVGKFTKFTSNDELSNKKSKFMQQLLEYLENN